MIESKISWAFLCLLMCLAVRASSLDSSDYVLQGVNTLTKDDQAGLANVGDLSDAEALDVDDTTDLEDEEYNEQSSDGETGRQADKRQLRKSCGPDITSWLLRQMRANMYHIEIRRCRSLHKVVTWPRCLLQFGKLVGGCKPWDFKCTQSFERGFCPYKCPRTVTLCNRCVNYDVPGNIHYGWVGRAASIRRWLLLYAAHRVQKGGVDDPKDQNAIKIGMDFWDIPRRRSRFCTEIRRRFRSLNRQGTSGCYTCLSKYNG